MDDGLLPQLEPSDETLAARAARRDVAAFSLLYDRYARLIYVMAAHTLGGADAEEVVQEVFLRLWNKAEQFQPARGPFRAWFMTVARHHLLDRLRRHGQHQRLVATQAVDQLLIEVVDPSADVEEQAWLLACGDAVLHALRELPAEQRRVLVLAYFGGLSQAAIAQGLGLPLGTVKKRTRLGLQKLRVSLSRQGLGTETSAGSTRTGSE